MVATNSLEKTLADAFKNAPRLPEKGRKTLVEWLPWLNLALGVLTLWAAYTLYHWASAANALVNYANSLSQAYGGPTVSTSNWSVTVWLGLLVLAVEGVLFIAAFPGTRAHQKSGWNLLFYALLLNAAYGVVSLFTNYGGVGSLLGYLIATIIGLYFLFEIRGSYKAGAKAKA